MKLGVFIFAGIAFSLLSLANLAWAQSARLDVVKSRGILRCGVSPNFAGFALPDSAGEWRGFDVDMCRAVAAAVLGDSRKTPVSAIVPPGQILHPEKGRRGNGMERHDHERHNQCEGAPAAESGPENLPGPGFAKDSCK